LALSWVGAQRERCNHPGLNGVFTGTTSDATRRYLVVGNQTLWPASAGPPTMLLIGHLPAERLVEVDNQLAWH
jgi:hypothetical protein